MNSQAVSKNIPGPTPSGGYRATVFYLDSNRQATTEDQAVFCEIVEFDQDGKELRRTYGEMKPKEQDAEQMQQAKEGDAPTSPTP